MTFGRLALASLVFYRRTHGMVALGVAAAVAVLAGSLLVGSSVRESLRALADSRLGRAAIVVAAEPPFTEGLAARLASATGADVAPLFALTGLVRHEASGRRAGDVRVYGVDDRFFAFHRVEADAPARSDVWLSADLAAELGAEAGDAIVVRVARPTDIPLDSLHGRREDVGRSMRLGARGVLGRAQMGDFSLAAGQGPSRAVFLSLARIQRDLELPGRANTLVVGGDRALEAADIRRAVADVATNADLGLRVEQRDGEAGAIVESASGLVSDSLAARVTAWASGEGRAVTPVLTWLANRLSAGARTVPYSLVSAIDLAPGIDETLRALLSGGAAGDLPPIVLNEWAARDLGAPAGSVIDVEYYRWADEGRLVVDRATFRFAGTIPMRGLAVDRRLAPDYPGITTAATLAAWDPPFPIDLKLIRRQDEDYWDEYRTSPKAFIPLAVGQALWGTRHGRLTSLRIAGAGAVPDFGAVVAAAGTGAGPLTVVAVKAQHMAASAGATDFGAYFSYFSFFLMVSAVLLAALFFRLSLEQRLPQLGVLRAAGFSIAALRRAALLEGGLVAAAGGVAGAGLAVAWAALMMYALRTWWVDAVGTTRLELHVTPLALAAGVAGAATAALAAIALAVRALGRLSPRAQMAGALPPGAAIGRRLRFVAPAALLIAAALSAASAAGAMPEAGGFFGAGTLMLVAGLAAFGAWLGGARGSIATPRAGLASLGLRNAAWRPGRSLTAAGLVAAAVFLLISVDSFRKRAPAASDRQSGTGGFALLAESQLPIVHDLSTREGREAAGLIGPTAAEVFAGLVFHQLRLRPGDDASCLNLYRPKQPRLVGVPEALADERRFSFARVIASADEAARANPWRLLDAPAPDGAVPAIVDQTSLQYVLHAAVGDVITIDADTSRPIDLRIVASLADSMLQGEILIGERQFQRLFPAIAGTRILLIEVPDAATARVDEVSRGLEAALEPFGLDVQSTLVRLEAFHRVENTYLSTFQALGGLGLVLGCVGLVAVVARNVLERRRELALLGAAGYTGRHLQRLVAVEHIAIVGIGLAIGAMAAAVAVGPVIVERSGAAPWAALVWLLPVAAAGALAAWGATRSVRRLPLVASLRSE